LIIDIRSNIVITSKRGREGVGNDLRPFDRLVLLKETDDISLVRVKIRLLYGGRDVIDDLVQGPCFLEGCFEGRPSLDIDEIQRVLIRGSRGGAPYPLRIHERLDEEVGFSFGGETEKKIIVGQEEIVGRIGQCRGRRNVIDQVVDGGSFQFDELFDIIVQHGDGQHWLDKTALVHLRYIRVGIHINKLILVGRRSTSRR